MRSSNWPGAADEGQALDVLVAARRLADQHHVGLRIAVGKDQVLRREFQVAAVEARPCCWRNSSSVAAVVARCAGERDLAFVRHGDRRLAPAGRRRPRAPGGAPASGRRRLAALRLALRLSVAGARCARSAKRSTGSSVRRRRRRPRRRRRAARAGCGRSFSVGKSMREHRLPWPHLQGQEDGMRGSCTR